MNIDQLSKARLRSGETSYVYGQGGTHHSYSHQERRSFVDYINFVLKDDPDLKHLIPIDKETDQIFKEVKNGLLLCKFINALAPGTIEETKIIRKQTANKYEILSNINLAINGGKKMGCNFVNINAEDIYEGTPHIVLGFFWNVIRVSLLNKVNLNRHPELINILQNNENVSSITDDNPEKVLLKWFNFHLKNANHPRVVNNFKSDISDGENYLVLLKQIAPDRVPDNLHLEKDPRKRAELVCQTAESLDALKFVNPEDIIKGNEKLNLAFTAYLFNKYPGLDRERSEEEKMRRLKLEEEQRLNEERLRQEEEKLAEYQRLVNEENKLKLEKLRIESEQQRRLMEEREQELKWKEDEIRRFEESRKFRELELKEQEELQRMKEQQMREQEEQQRLREESIRRMEEQQKLREEQLRLEEEEQMRKNEEAIRTFQSDQQQHFTNQQQQFQQQQQQQQFQTQQPIFTQFSQQSQDQNMHSQYQHVGYGQMSTATHNMFSANMGTYVIPPIAQPPPTQRVVLSSVVPQVTTTPLSAYTTVTTYTSPPPPPPPPPTTRVIVTRTTTIRRRF